MGKMYLLIMHLFFVYIFIEVEDEPLVNFIYIFIH